MKHINIDMKLNDIGEQTIGSLYRQHQESIVQLQIADEEYNDHYCVKLQKTNLGIGGMCFLNHKPSYQADFTAGGGLKLKEVINNIAGGVILAST